MRSSKAMAADQIVFHSPELCSELLEVELSKEDSVKDRSADKVPSCPSRPSPTRLPSRSSAAAQMTRIQDWLSRKARRAVVALPDDPDLVVVKELCDTILREEAQFLTELDSYLTSHAEQDLTKKEMLYKKWSKRVFVPLRRKLASVMGREYKMVDNQKRKLFDQYLEYRNKHNVFLDIISEEDYDPLLLSNEGHCMKVQTGVLDDPLISQPKNFAIEKLVIRSLEEGLTQAMSSPPAPLGRENTDAVVWLAMELVQIDSDVRTRSRKKMKPSRNNSSQMDSQSSGLEEEELLGQDLGFRELNVPHKTPLREAQDQVQGAMEWKDES